MGKLHFKLPWPPSMNTYWRHVVVGRQVRVLLSEQGRTYRDEVHKELALQRVRRGRIASSMRVTLEAFPPDLRARDLDNLPKGILESLKHSGVINDDKHIDELRIVRRHVAKRGVMLVTIEQLESDAQLFPPEAVA